MIHFHVVRYRTDGPHPIFWRKVAVCIGDAYVMVFDVPPVRGFLRWWRLNRK